jgi:signal transduction histidine kinase
VTLMACARHAGDLFVAADRQQAEDQRLRTLHRAQQLVVAGQMAAGVAHEVRNPLSTIRSTIQYVLASNSDWPHKLALLSDTLHEVDRIDHAVSGMLNVSRPTTPTMVDTDLTEIVADALKLVRGCADAREVEFRSLLGDRVTVQGDARELRQVFVNLLLNACQAQPAGGLVEVASHAMADSSGAARQAAVRIADRGPGIPLDLIERVFDPFYTSKPNGTGLGLPICREIVARHGGHLDLQCPGRGTVVTVLLPLKEGV